MDAVIWLYIVISLTIYFLPAIIANLRSHHQQGAITMLNLLLGWTLLGWIIAIIWSVSATPGRASRQA